MHGATIKMCYINLLSAFQDKSCTIELIRLTTTILKIPDEKEREREKSGGGGTPMQILEVNM